MRDLRPFLCAAALALPALARPASAQAPTSSASPTIAAAPIEAMTAKARELYADGLKAFQKQKWAEAYAAFTGAWALQKHYAVAGNLGAAEVQLGRYRDAAEHLAIYTKGITEDPKRTAKERESATLLYDVAMSKIVTLAVSVSPPGADVWIDGMRAGAAPLAGPLFLEPGKHTVEVKLDGHVTDKRDFEAVAGEKKAFDVALSKRQEIAPTASASATGTPPPPRSLVPAFVLGGVGAASLIAGGVLFGASLSTADGAQKQKEDVLAKKGSCVPGASNIDPRCPEIEGNTRAADTLNRAAIGVWIGTAAIAAGTALYVLWPRESTRSSGFRIVPVVSTTGGAFVASGKW